MYQNANVSERNYTNDNRGGGLIAVKWTPNDSFTVTANYIHTNLWSLPDFGVPYNLRRHVAGHFDSACRATPITASSIATSSKCSRISAPSTANIKVNRLSSRWSNKIRDERSILNYVGTIPEQGTCNGTASRSPAESGQLDGLPQSAEPLSGH